MKAIRKATTIHALSWQCERMSRRSNMVVARFEWIEALVCKSNRSIESALWTLKTLFVLIFFLPESRRDGASARQRKDRFQTWKESWKRNKHSAKVMNEQRRSGSSSKLKGYLESNSTSNKVSKVSHKLNDAFFLTETANDRKCDWLNMRKVTHRLPRSSFSFLLFLCFGRFDIVCVCVCACI